MWRIKGRRTLYEDIEKLKCTEKSRSIGQKKGWLITCLSILAFVIGYLQGMVYYMALFLLVIELFRCLFAKHRFQKAKCNSKELKQQEIIIRTAAETILLLYFISIGLLLAVYGCMIYVLQMPGFWFLLKEWMKYSILLFLFFEIIVLMFYRKIEREVRYK